jgi:protoheme IX farnesyltransferase
MINYYLLTKPGIILGNLLTVAAGFLLASKGTFNLPLFCYTLMGLALIMASSCVFNNYIDRQKDKLMNRTKGRPLVQGTISPRQAILFASFLFILGNALLYSFTNLLTLFVANFGFIVYVFFYSFWKSHTIHGTAIGSIAGAVPPVVGYCAVSNQFDIGAFILFAILVLWQMPHFLSIAILHLEDYRRANIPVLPVIKGIETTKRHIVLYIIAFIPATILLTYFGFTGKIYLFSSLALGLMWLYLSLQGFKREDNKQWGRQMFRFSLVTIVILCFLIPL